MKNITNTHMFLAVFEKWRKKNKLPEIPMKRNNRSDCQAAIVDYDNPDVMYLEYNAKKLDKLAIGMAVNIALHEVGHLKYHLPYNTFADEVYSEYTAEKYAVDVMKKYFPSSQFRQTVKWAKKKLADKKWCTKEISHSCSMSQIKEYTQ